MVKKERRETLQAAVQQVAAEPPQTWDLTSLFQHHQKTVYWAAYRVTGSEADAEDVLQTVFTRLSRREELPDFSGNPKAYLKRAAVNASLDVLRSRKPGRTVALSDIEGFLSGRENERPDRQQSSAEFRDWLRNAIGQLSPRAAEVFTLRFLEGYGNHEIAKMLGTSQSTIAVTLHRTRNRLRHQLEDFFGGTI